MDGQNGIPGVILVEKQCSQLGFLEFLVKGPDGPAQIVQNLLAFLGQFQQDFNLFLVIFQLLVELQVFFQLLFSLLQGLKFFLVAPGFGAG
ncbi:MAG TPA: hypothetical protein DCR87_03730 [Acidobacteria bacterium]|nr:hypothetical protein [Acidobacteriota bacterium]